jgi:phosphoglycerate kinase|tara:strand:+ start:7413 stop:8714 length:1302 start_codon:yes stop_codon:yes gene_type:complete
VAQNSSYVTVDGEFDSLEDRSFLTMDDYELSGENVILRIDINSSINPENGDLLDDTRIKRHSATVKELSDKNARVIVLAHQSRPGKLDFVNLEKHGKRMSEIIEREIKFVDDIYGEKAIQEIKNIKDGQIILLDNVRFDKEEINLKTFENDNFMTQSKARMVKTLAPHASYFVNDAFAASHRCQPSLVGFSEYMPALAGRVMQRELDFLGKAISSGPTPRIAVLGGSKAADSVSIAENFLEKGVEQILTGGVVANIFLIASGIDIGKPSTEFIEKQIPDHEKVIELAKKLLSKYDGKIEIPSDVALNKDGKRYGTNVENLPEKYPLFDIGVDTLVRYIQIIENAGTVIANGPMGVFEDSEFATGTNEIFSAISKSKGMTVVGGGETAMAFNQMGLAEGIKHISTGGGACISFMSGETMPALEAMRRSKKRFND